MDQFKKNAAVIVLGVIAAAMLIGNICFVVFAKSSVKKATITKQEVKTVAGKDVRYEEDSDNFTVSKSSNISEKMESPAAATPEPEATADAPDASQNNGDYIFPDSDSRKLKKSEVKKLSKKELRYARNELYARHGYIFEDEELKDYFESKSWYTPSVAGEDFNDEEYFNEYEIANRNLIKKIEAKKK